jgi:hypothetical protein
MIGRSRPERVFNVAHTGGDLSAPDAVRSVIMPSAFPAAPQPVPEARGSPGPPGSSTPDDAADADAP